jgi:ATP/maltotriose-dependent transcriptional regulator MalT
MPVPDAISRCEEYVQIVAPSARSRASVFNALAVLYAMQGDFQRAEHHLREANAILDEFGGLVSHVPHFEAIVGMLAGRPERAEAVLRSDIGPLASMHGTSTLATTYAMLAQAVYTQDRVDEAAALCRVAAQATARDDVFTQAISLGVMAKCLARGHRCADAEKLARAGVALAEPTDLLSLKADGMLDLVDVLRMCDQTDAASDALREGLALCRLKRNTAAAANAIAPNPESE